MQVSLVHLMYTNAHDLYIFIKWHLYVLLLSFSIDVGNKFASAGDFNMAVKYFTDAIKYNPTEFK